MTARRYGLFRCLHMMIPGPSPLLRSASSKSYFSTKPDMEITAGALASMIGGEVEGNGDVALHGFAKIEEAKPGELSFIANPKYAHFASSTTASALLVSRDFAPEGEVKATLIRVADPYSTLAELLTYIQSMKPGPKGIEEPARLPKGFELPEDGYVGAFAYIGDGVKLGKGVKIYPQAYIGANVQIGEGTVIRAGVKIYEDCRIGSRCIIHSGAVIGADGFGFAPKGEIYEKIPQVGNVVIEDDVEIGANTTVDRATFGSTRIGRGTKLDNLIQIAHNVEVGTNNVFASQVGVAGSTKIGNSNRVGGQVGFAGHINIGDRNEFGAQSGIPSNIGDNQRLIGTPVIPFRQWAKNLVYISRLEELFKKK